MPVSVRQMRREDIAQVSVIDREAFPTEWPAPNFKNELENRLAHYIVACDAEKTVEKPEVKAPSRKGFAGLISSVSRLFGHDRLSSNEPLAQSEQYIIGYTGFWIMADEAHISTIATQKAYRRQGIGELLLISTIDLATKLKARIITLEVRISNTAAQSLYSRYGFTQVGVRRGYYINNKEDAILMSTDSITSASFRERLNQLKQAHSMKWGNTQYQVRH